jgi:hypothetical protein
MWFWDMWDVGRSYKIVRLSSSVVVPTSDKESHSASLDRRCSGSFAKGELWAPSTSSKSLSSYLNYLPILATSVKLILLWGSQYAIYSLCLQSLDVTFISDLIHRSVCNSSTVVNPLYWYKLELRDDDCRSSMHVHPFSETRLHTIWRLWLYPQTFLKSTVYVYNRQVVVISIVLK